MSEPTNSRTVPLATVSATETGELWRAHQCRFEGGGCVECRKITGLVQRGDFEILFADGTVLLAHQTFAHLTGTDRAWFSRLYVDHKCVAGSDGATLIAALRGLEDEVRDATNRELRELIGL